MAKKLASGADTTSATRDEQPIILIRGFGGLGVEDEKKVAYQGFNDGTVYPRKSGENYIYEGLILRFMKSRWTYNDATNVVGYYNSPVTRAENSISKELKGFDHDLFSGHKVVIDPATALTLLRSPTDVRKTLWVFRYYDLDDRKDFMRYGEALVRLITFIRTLAEQKDQGLPKVNIIAHSMGGLIVREAVQRTYPKGEAAKHINKIVTLGTPHQGIAFQISATGSGSARPTSWSSSTPIGRKLQITRSDSTVRRTLPARAGADGGRHQLPHLRPGGRELAEPRLLGRRRVRCQLQPQRRPGEAGLRAASRRSARPSCTSATAAPICSSPRARPSRWRRASSSATSRCG